MASNCLQKGGLGEELEASRIGYVVWNWGSPITTAHSRICTQITPNKGSGGQGENKQEISRSKGAGARKVTRTQRAPGFGGQGSKSSEGVGHREPGVLASLLTFCQDSSAFSA